MNGGGRTSGGGGEESPGTFLQREYTNFIPSHFLFLCACVMFNDVFVNVKMNRLETRKKMQKRI